MNPNRKAWWHLACMGVCLLVADYLPSWQKPWFVSETGHYNTSSFITVLLLWGMFLQWRLALGLMVVWQVVHFGIIYLALSHYLPTGDHYLGYILTSALRLTAVAIIFFSAEVNRYVRYKAANGTSAMQP